MLNIKITRLKNDPVINGKGYPRYSNANPPHSGPSTRAKAESDWLKPSVIPCSASDVTSEIKLNRVGCKEPVPRERMITIIDKPRKVPPKGISPNPIIIQNAPIEMSLSCEKYFEILANNPPWTIAEERPTIPNM